VSGPSRPRKSLESTLLLATRNVREFDSPAYGDRRSEAYYFMAEIVSRFDLVAVQAVPCVGGADVDPGLAVALSCLQRQQRYYRTYWRTFQMSDHLPMWLELRIDCSAEYFDGRARGSVARSPDRRGRAHPPHDAAGLVTGRP
jgi:endonuclease/exonuclease/phosphatase family metal-dependent hydrolase